jgi:hypothetical protein
VLNTSKYDQGEQGDGNTVSKMGGNAKMGDRERET